MSDKTLDEKYAQLLDLLRSQGRVVVAYSGGVDSTFLLHAAHTALGDDAIAVIADSPLFPRREICAAERFAKDAKIPYRVIETQQLDDARFRSNQPERCYVCKLMLLSSVQEEARRLRASVVVEGSNTDDEQDYRPGSRAIEELGVLSPLKLAGLSKDEIRALSRKEGLPTWDKPSFACLASRISFGEEITVDQLGTIEQAESALFDLGFSQARARAHGNLVRIELLPEEIEKACEEETRLRIASSMKELGFEYATLDLSGYRTGSMNTFDSLVNKESL